MKLKKAFSLLMASALLVGTLAGCGGGGDDKANGGDAAQDTPSTSDDGGNADAAGSGSGSDAGADAGSDSTASGTAFKVGGTGPLTGGAAIYGNAAKNGAQIAVDEINAEGGAIQFELKYEDDENDPEKAMNAYNALKDWGMQLSLGAVTSKPAEATSGDHFNDRIFALTPSASSVAVTEGKDNIYQICFKDPNQGLASAQYIAEQNLGTKIAVIYQNDDVYSAGIHDVFIEEAKNRGLEIVSDTAFSATSATDFTVQLTEAKNKGADLLFLPLYYQADSLIITQANAMGYTPKIFGVDGMDGILTLDGFDASLAEGVMLLTPFNAEDQDEKTQAFVKTYQEKFGEVPNQFAADAYDCIYAYKQALETAGATPDMSAQDLCEKMIEVFPTMTFYGLTGDEEGLTWDNTGAVSKSPKGMVIQNGVYVGM